ncbi:MAG TPA: response regulator [Chryseolinea sp.]|nr:response regulator [Chryseolinea sp.]
MMHTVVLIDDDPDDVDFLAEAIKDFDGSIECVSFTNPVRAITHLLSADFTREPTCIFLDYNMPELTGLECLTILRDSSRYKLTPMAVISTGLGSSESGQFGRSRCSKAGANFAVEKPSTMSGYQKLLAEIFSALANR